MSILSRILFELQPALFPFYDLRHTLLTNARKVYPYGWIYPPKAGRENLKNGINSIGKNSRKA